MAKQVSTRTLVARIRRIMHSVDARGFEPVLTGVVAAALTFSAVLVGHSLQDHHAAVLWPAAGVSAGLVLVSSGRNRLAAVIGIFAAVMLGKVVWRNGLAASLVLTLGNVGQAYLIAFCLERVSGRPFQLDRVRNVLAFLLLAAPVVAATAAAVGVGLEASGQSLTSFSDAWWPWFTAHAAGVLTVMPAVLAIAGRESRQRSFEAVDFGPALAVAAAGVVPIGSFFPWIDRVLLLAAIVLFPLLAWALLRSSVERAAVALLVIAATVIWQTGSPVGVFAGNVPEAQAFLGGAAGLLLLLGAWRGGTELFPRPATEKRQHGFRGLYASALLVPMISFVIAGWWTWERVNAEARRSVENRTAILAEYVTRLLEAHETLLSAALARARGMSWDEIPGSRELYTFLAEADDHVRSSASTILVRLDTGRAIASNTMFPAPDADLSNRDYVRAHRARHPGTYFGEVVRTSPSGLVGFTLSRRDPQSNLLAVSLISLAALHEEFATQLRSELASITLVRDDGALLARLPHIGEPVGFRMSQDSVAASYLRGELSGVSAARSRLDGIDRLYHARRLADYPAYIVYGDPIRELRAEWLRMLAPFAVFSLVCAAFLSYLVHRTQTSSRRQFQAEIVAEAQQARAEKAEAVAASEARLGYVLEAAKAGAWQIELEPGAVNCSPECHRILGIADADPVTSYESLKALIHPEDLPAHEAAVTAALAGGSEYESEYRVVWPDRSVHWIYARGRPIFDVTGRAASITGIMIDITERKRAEERLRDTSRLLEGIMNSAPASIYIFNCRTRRVEFASGQARERLGYTEEDWARQSLMDLMHPDDGQKLAAHLERLSADIPGQPLEIEYRMRHADGSWRWFRSRDVVYERAPDGSLLRIVGTAIDVSGRRRAERALRASERKLKAVLGALPVGVALVDADGSTQLANATFRRYVPEKIPSHDDARGPMWVRFDEQGRRVERDQFPAARALRGETVYPGHDFLFNDPDGPPVWARVAAIPFRDEDGLLSGAVAVITDIDQEKRAVAALRESEARLRNILDNTLAFIGVMDLSGTLLEANEPKLVAGGLKREDVIGRKLWDCYWWVHDEREVERLKQATADAALGSTVRYDAVLRTKGDARMTVDLMIAPVRDADGEVRLLVPSSLDISDRKRAESQIRLLMSEVNHRAKNLLGIVQAIARQTKAGDPATFVERLSQRLQALAAAQDLLVRNEWGGVEVDELVRSQLAPLTDFIESRVRIEGPRVRLNPAAAQGIGMALHELATNAIKYGSLSASTGRVSISWRIEGAGEAQKFAMEWREEDGPPVEPPARKGFGQLVIVDMARSAVQGDAEVAYHERGLVWTLSARASSALEQMGGAPPVSIALDL